MVAAMAALVEAEAAACEQRRTTTPEVVAAMWDTGLMGRFNPSEAGGGEPTFAEMIETWIAMARLDGSFGWIGIANLPTTAAVAAYLPDAGFAEVFTAHDDRITMGGQLFPNGTGETVDGGYRLTGSWSFGSGTGHSEYVAAGFMPLVDGELVYASEGIPELRVAVMPRDEVRFTDGWHVQGLKGTGSYDYEVADVVVPAHRTFELFTRTPGRGSAPTFRMGLMPLVAAGHASWALGVARSMLDDLTELALSKVRMGDPAPLAHKPSFQVGLARHESMWRAARLLVGDAFDRIEAAVGAGEELTPTLRADGRAAAVYATDASREIAQWAHLAAGTTAIREGSRLERAFRDLYTGTQHAFIGEKVAVDSAQVWLGVVDDPIGL
ncbi:acyl-CoA dehydrogenase [Iamia sp. SCSIO 61187]|uniref:acyl-CoA dehydrogenase family protein n=1 Tax=Iamia sp. SCSIO 61187 TaxID=2722752 RepID=UPI00351CF132|nr:acyl-CoA dehydrogenase [Iamia sp. SCSIO 61187]